MCVIKNQKNPIRQTNVTKHDATARKIRQQNTTPSTTQMNSAPHAQNPATAPTMQTASHIVPQIIFFPLSEGVQRSSVSILFFCALVFMAATFFLTDALGRLLRPRFGAKIRYVVRRDMRLPRKILPAGVEIFRGNQRSAEIAPPEPLIPLHKRT